MLPGMTPRLPPGLRDGALRVTIKSAREVCTRAPVL